MAAAKQDEKRAAAYMRRAIRLQPDSPLLSTMCGQIYAQGKLWENSRELHTQALKQVKKRENAQQSILLVNSSLDLAVALANLDKKDDARAMYEKAKALLQKENIPKADKALGYLQAGVVSQTALQDKESAIKAWQDGNDMLRNIRELDGFKASVSVDLALKIAAIYTDEKNLAEAAKQLESARKITSKLPEELKVTAKYQIGAAYVRLVDKDPERSSEYSKVADALLAQVIETKSDSLATQKVSRNANLARAKLYEGQDKQKAREYSAEALRMTWDLEKKKYQQQSQIQVPETISPKIQIKQKELKLKKTPKINPRLERNLQRSRSF